MTCVNGYQNTAIIAKGNAAVKQELIDGSFTESETLTYNDLSKLSGSVYTSQTPTWVHNSTNKTQKWTPDQYVFSTGATIYGYILIDASSNLIDVHHFVDPNDGHTPISVSVGPSNPLSIGEITLNAGSSPPIVIA